MQKKRIPADVYEKGIKRELGPEGVCSKNLKYFVNGVVISTKSKIKTRIEGLNKEKIPYFKKRYEGVVQDAGDVTR